MIAVIDHNHHQHSNQARNCNNDRSTQSDGANVARVGKLLSYKKKRTTNVLLNSMPLSSKHVKMVSQDIEHIHDPKLVAPNIANLPGPPTSLLVPQHQTRF